MRRIFNYFLQGLLYIAPVAVTGYIIYKAFTLTDGLLQEYLNQYLHIRIPGLGIVVLFVLLTLLGFFGQSIIARPFNILFKRIMERAPYFKMIYNAVRDFFMAFAGKEKKFTKPVKVLIYPGSGIFKLGFITETDLGKINELEKVAVYMPYSYSFMGELLIVPRDLVQAIDISAADAMKFMVSGGVTGWDDSKENELK